MALYDIYAFDEIYDVCEINVIYAVYGQWTIYTQPLSSYTTTHMLDNTRNTMNITQRLLEISPRPTLRLTEILRLIKKHRIIIPVPSKPTLIALCENGTFETVGGQATRFGWLVYEDSFLKWVKSLAG